MPVKKTQRLHGTWCNRRNRAMPSCIAQQTDRKKITNIAQIKTGHSKAIERESMLKKDNREIKTNAALTLRVLAGLMQMALNPPFAKIA